VKPFPISVVRAEELIPRGIYCYTPQEAPSEANGYVYWVKPCPFWKKLTEHPDQMSGWCDYLKTGDMVQGGTDLLWDQVKECGIKDDDFDD
jgi:hypothetical protein